MRHSAPDVLKARIRTSLAAESAAAAAATQTTARVTRPSSWPRLAAAGIAIALLSSAITFATTRRADTSSPVERELLASHIRSLQPGHLTDVASSDQHNVKPWFNGRIDMSPSVPSLDSAGFPIVGGRLDYIDGRTAAAVVYSRRQHLINVYSWPTSGADERPRSFSDHGYHFVQWKRGGIEQWAVSDLNTAELDQFVAAFFGASPTTPSR